MMRETRYAILIGNSHYPFDDHLVDLRAPKQDVEGLAGILGDPQIGRCGDVRRLINMPHQDVLDDIQYVFRQAQKDDFVLFYFSGHGLLDEQGRFYLAVANTQSDLLRLTSLPLENIQALCDTCRSTRIVLILDCCFSGLQGLHMDVALFVRAMHQLSTGRGKYTMTASPDNQNPPDKDIDAYSLLTHHLIEGLKTGQANIDGTGMMTADHLYQYIYAQVTHTPPYRAPMKWDLSAKGGLIIGWTTRTAAPSMAVRARYDAMIQLFKKGEVIPFLGPGVAAHGADRRPPVDIDLARQLAARVGFVDSAEPLTTMSQKIHILAGRGMVYNNLRDLYQPTSHSYSPALTHWFLARMPQPLLILSTAYDTLLEDAFDEVGKKYVVVAHILHAENRIDRGKVVVQYSDRRDQVTKCLSEDLVIDLQAWSIIYKIHGGFGLVDPDTDEEIDSIVISEEDYIALVTLLEHPQTTIPNHLMRQFKKRMFLFLGYQMNDWNFRAVVDLIHRKGNFQRLQPYAVRQHVTDFERLYWENKQVRLLETDIPTLVREVAAAIGIDL
jgi:hypothetical protein